MLLPQFACLASCKLMPVSRATPCAPACIESLHQSSRRGALTLLALIPPLVIAEAATAAEGIAGRNERVVVPILGDLMGLAGPGAHALSQTGPARQTMLRARSFGARSFGLPRLISRLGRSGRPYWLCSRHS